jgi:hypothetical protein
MMMMMMIIIIIIYIIMYHGYFKRRLRETSFVLKISKPLHALAPERRLAGLFLIAGPSLKKRVCELMSMDSKTSSLKNGRQNSKPR